MIDQLNLGVNYSATFQDQFGNSFTPDDLGSLISVNLNSKSTLLESKPINLDGENRYMREPGSYTVDFEFDRANGQLMGLVLAHDEDYYNKKPQRSWTVYVTVTNPDGTTDQYLCARGVFHTEGEGPWQKGALVRTKFSMEFSRVRKVDGLSGLVA